MKTIAVDVETTAPIAGRIEDIVRTVPGWSPLDQLMALFTLAYTSEAEGDIIELGSWCGRSTAALGLAAKLTGQTSVYAVDLFPERDDWRRNADGSYSFTVTIAGRECKGYHEQTVWAEPYQRDIAPLYEAHNGILDIFQDTLRRHALVDVVTPFRGDSRMFAAAAPSSLRCKLAFIDGDHSYEAVCQDIEAIEPFLLPGGWICFDDAFSYYDGVNNAITDRIVRSGRYDRCHQLTRKFFVARRRPFGRS